MAKIGASGVKWMEGEERGGRDCRDDVRVRQMPYIADAWCHGDRVRVMRTIHKCQDEGLSEVEGGCSPHQRLLVDERHELQIGMRHWLQLQTPHIPHALRQMLL